MIIEKIPILDSSLNKLSDYFIVQQLLKRGESLEDLVLIISKLVNR